MYSTKISKCDIYLICILYGDLNLNFLTKFQRFIIFLLSFLGNWALELWHTVLWEGVFYPQGPPSFKT